MKCEECGCEQTKDGVCTNCGLVSIERCIDYSHPKIRRNEKTKEKEQIGEYYNYFSPDIRYMHNGTKKYYKKNKKEYKYLKAYFDIKKFCSIFDVPNAILNESLNIYKEIRKKDKDFFKKNGLEPSYLSFIKIACKIHGFYLPKKRIIELCNTRYNDEKRFNSAYYNTLKTLNMYIRKPEIPPFISYSCNELDYSQSFCRNLQNIYKILGKRLNYAYKSEGYVLALLYILKDDITIHELAKKFAISASTISSRKNEIRRILKMNLNDILLELNALYKERGKKDSEPLTFHKELEKGKKIMVIVGVGNAHKFIMNVKKMFKRTVA